MSPRCLQLTTICIIAIWTVSCTAHYKLYEGDHFSPKEVAVLISKDPFFRSHGLYLDEVDGKGAPDAYIFKKWYGSKLDGSFRIELSPGEHTLSVSYRGKYISVRNQRITFYAQAGRTYTIKAFADTQKMTWRAWVEEIDSGTK